MDQVSTPRDLESKLSADFGRVYEANERNNVEGNSIWMCHKISISPKCILKAGKGNELGSLCDFFIIGK
jgi:hypothetical protein